MTFQVQEENGDFVDQFDRLPDALVRLIFNQVIDAKSLCRCMSVCKRFSSIIPEINTISLTIPRKNSNPISSDNYKKELNDQNSKSKGGLSRNLLKSLINKVITKSVQFILQIIIPNSSSKYSKDDNEKSYYSPNEVLKSFNEIQFLQIELPGHGGEIKSNGGDSLLKWKAEFGSELESCVVLGATSFQKTTQKCIENKDKKQIDRSEAEAESGSESESFSFSDEDLKLRVIWTISCLIASSARHYLLQQVVSDHLMLKSVEITDRSKQGKLLMREKQIDELRMCVNSPEKSESPLERTKVPNLKMKLWYVPKLELPESGFVMKGATLVVISPVDSPARKGELLLDGVFDGDEEEKALGEAVREIMKKKKMYTLEMNSF